MTNKEGETGEMYRRCIEVEDDSDVNEWARRLGVTPKVLQDAIRQAGNWSADVQRELNTGRHGTARL